MYVCLLVLLGFIYFDELSWVRSCSSILRLKSVSDMMFK
jgi:hypothetical protein